MPRIELRDPTHVDRDAAYPLLRDGSSTWRRARFADRAEFDAWLDEQKDRDDVTLHAVVVGGEARGLAAALEVDGEREIVFALTAGVDGESTAEALRLITSREPVRPLYACVAAADDPSHEVLAGIGFVEWKRGDDEIVYVLPPTLE